MAKQSKPLHQEKLVIDMDDLNDIINKIIADKKNPERLVVHTAEGVHILKVSNIIRCSADDNYTVFHLIDGSKVVVAKTLKEYAQTLEKYSFFRTHQSHLINLEYVKQFVNTDGGCVVMQNDEYVLVSRRRKKILLETLLNQTF